MTVSSRVQQKVVVSVSDIADGVATINWLLDHGAHVSVIGERSSEIEKRVDTHLKRTARDGKAYDKVRACLTWTTDRSSKPTDLHALFCSAWKKKIVGITGAHGKTTVAAWAAHLIGDAIAAGHMPGKPLLPALDSKASFAILEMRDGVVGSPRMHIVRTDDISNRDAAVQAARYAGVSEALIAQRCETLPQVPMRQEVIAQTTKLTVINDALADGPERGAFALARWGGPTCVVVCGGGGASADYARWAELLQSTVRRTNVILLSGSATQKMRVALGEYGRGIRAYDSLEVAYKAAQARAGLYVSSVILFSPAAKSYELFANEYDRGQQFNALVERRGQRRKA
jgi:UDP-N-acetylmuramoylalanine-D-glutamate ligase